MIVCCASRAVIVLMSRNDITLDRCFSATDLPKKTRYDSGIRSILIVFRLNVFSDITFCNVFFPKSRIYIYEKTLPNAAMNEACFFGVISSTIVYSELINQSICNAKIGIYLFGRTFFFLFLCFLCSIDAFLCFLRTKTIKE
mgnify:FL=1